MIILKLIFNRIKSSIFTIYSLIGVLIAAVYLWMKYKIKKLNEAKETLRVKDFIIDQQENIIKEQKQQSEKVENVKEFYQDLRTKLNDFTE